MMHQQARQITASSNIVTKRLIPPAVRLSRPSLQRSIVAAAGPKEADQVTGVIFEPFNAAKTELATISKTDGGVESFARSNFHVDCEAAINEQINVEYNMSYVYHSLYAYFDRDNVALPNIAKYFQDQSVEERGHAEKLMKYQNIRGGRVKLHNIVLPEVEYGQDKEKGDALYAFELALSLEKLNFGKLRELVDVAARYNDQNMSDYVEGQLLAEQVESVKQTSEYVAQLRRVGKGLGVYIFDKEFK